MIFGYPIVDLAKSYLIIQKLKHLYFSNIFASRSVKGRSRGISTMIVGFLYVNMALIFLDIPKLSKLDFQSFLLPFVSRVGPEVSAPLFLDIQLSIWLRAT